MWGRNRVLFETYPERLQGAKFLLQHGLSVKGDKIYVNEIEITILKVDRAVGVDRRTVNGTIRAMSIDGEIKMILSKLESAGPSLRAVAEEKGLRVLEIIADDPNKVGILANASGILAHHGVSIRQELVDDPELSPIPSLLSEGWSYPRKGHSANSEDSSSRQGVSLLVTETLTVTKGNIYSLIPLPKVTNEGLSVETTAKPVRRNSTRIPSRHP